jgi:hypothetical protein
MNPDRIFCFDEAVGIIATHTKADISTKQIRNQILASCDKLESDKDLQSSQTLGYMVCRDNEGGYEIWIAPWLIKGIPSK